MRILIATYAEKTHFWAMVPTVWALQTAGHEVWVASQPELTDVITSAGLTAVPVGKDHTLYKFLRRHTELPTNDYQDHWFDFTENRPEMLTWDYVSKGYDDAVLWWWRVFNDSMIDELTDFCCEWKPDLVIWEAVTYAGAIAARASGAVHARYMWGADLFTRMRRHYLRLLAEQPGGDNEDMLARWLGARVGRYGKKFAEVMTHGYFTIDSVPASLRLDPALGLDHGLHQLPVRHVPYNGGTVVPAWLHEPATKPRVALTLGVSSSERLHGYTVRVQELLDSLGELDIELVATLSAQQQKQLTRVPDNTRLVTFVPFQVLAPTCSAIIHHGGIGTYNTTLLGGVPQLIVPNMFDLPVRADYLDRQGAGIHMPTREVTGEKVRDAVRRLLEEPSFRENALRLREEMLALPTPNDLVPQIEKLTAEYGAEAQT